MFPTLRFTLRSALSACALLALSAGALSTANATAATVEVHVTGLSGGARGKVAVAVCDRAHFLKECTYHASLPAHDGENVVSVPGVPAGTWAVLVYQDENDNGKLDRNFIGIPSEPYGFSRDARSHFGPPSFEDAAIEVKAEPTVANVKLN